MTTQHSLSDIHAQIKSLDEARAKLHSQANELRNHARKGVIDELKARIAEYGLSAADLGLSGRAPRAAGPARKARASAARPAKYAGPDGKTWSGGRGRKPFWVVEALAAGKSLSDFEIR